MRYLCSNTDHFFPGIGGGGHVNYLSHSIMGGNVKVSYTRFELNAQNARVSALQRIL